MNKSISARYEYIHVKQDQSQVLGHEGRAENLMGEWVG